MKVINEVDVKGKKVLVRVDFNVPIKDGQIVDDTRIVGSLKTINYLIEHKAKIILMSHLGRIESEEDKQKNSLITVAKHLTTLVNTSVYFVPNTRGDTLETTINNLQDGEILLMENTRFEDFPKKLESSCDESLSKYWASLADIFVLDAFGTAHRCHASTYGISKYIPSYAGFLLKEEVDMLDKVIDQDKNIILGGAKVSDKIGVIDNLIDNTSKFLLAGAMCFTFLRVEGYNVGKSPVSEENIDYVKNLVDRYKDKMILPVDIVTQNGVKHIHDMDDDDIGYDIGPETIEIFKDALKESNLVLWNGPIGKYEEKQYEKGTRELMEYLSKQDYPTILAGGDITGAAKTFNLKLYYVSTGGGSTLEYLEGKNFKTIGRLNG